MDGPHQQVHKGPDRKERQEAGQRARRRLGAGRRSRRLHGRQKDPIQPPQPEGELQGLTGTPQGLNLISIQCR